MKDLLKKNDIYKGFKVLDVVDVQEFDSTGYYLKHEKSGLEVFHLLNHDKENLFAYSFRTPSSDSTGVAHVLEHSVLCGSKKYPAKDPFLQLTKQSINTYLNAWTTKDRTVFPSSSLVQSDYFNIMSVYTDAVFFPLLKPETFLQECWRLELDKKNKCSIQGVVFNEMKGNYSSFISVASDEISKSLFPNSIYNFDSGGDPLVIPSLTLKKLKAFHKKYYCTNNCLLFLYGNIPTEKQLDFIEENLISKVSSYGKKTVVKDSNVSSTIKNYRAYAPAENDNVNNGKLTENIKSSIALSWKLGKNIYDSSVSVFEIQLLYDLLFGSDSAPLRKVLLKKFPTGAISPLSGISINGFYNCFTIAFSELKENQKNDFKNTINQVLKELEQNGFPEDDVERTFMDLEMRNLEIQRSYSGGPFSLTLLRHVLHAWTYGMQPWKFLGIKKETEDLKNILSKDKNYLQKLLTKYFIQNNQNSLAVIIPSAKWTEKRIKKESLIAKKLLKEIGLDKVQSNILKMTDYQNTEDKDVKIPAVKIKDLEIFDEGITAKTKLVNGVPFIFSEQPCNNIIYASISFPVDVLKPEDYLYLPLLEETLTSMGWGKLNWEKASALADKNMGSFSVGVRRSAVSNFYKRYMEKKSLIVGREWLTIRVKFIEDRIEEVFKIIEDCINGVDFSDSKRLKTIIYNSYSTMKINMVSQAHYYASLRSTRTLSRIGAINEVLDGITCKETFNNLKKMKIKEVQSKLCSLFKKIKSSGALWTVVADKKGINLVQKRVAKSVENLALIYPKPKRKANLADFVKLSEINKIDNNKKDNIVDEVFILPGDIGFACCAVESSPSGTKECMEDVVLAHILEKTELWSEIRMAGGAYGVFFNANGSMSFSKYLTYRDPKPFESIRVFYKILKNLEKREWTQEEIEHSICGIYAEDIEPMTPQSKGMSGIMRVLYGGSDSYHKKRIEQLLKMNKKGIEKSCKRYIKAKKIGRTVVMCGKSLLTPEIIERCGKIIKLNI